MATEPVPPVKAIQITADNQTLVSRNNSIQVWDGEEFSPAFVTRHGDRRKFTPSQILLQNRSSKTLLLSPIKQHLITTYDTETGKRLSEMKCSLFESDGVSLKIKDIGESVKYSSLEEASTISCNAISNLGIVSVNWDPRVKQDEIVISQNQLIQLATKKQKFTCAAATTNGGVVAGSKDGTVRIYTNISGQRAKNLFEQYACGEPVISVDVSADGEWILWTSRNFLSLAKTSFIDKKGQNASGFGKSMGKEKQQVMQIRLCEEDLQSIGVSQENLYFTPARFDTGPSTRVSGITERSIITSTENFILHWNLRLLERDYKRLTDGDTNYAATRPRLYRQTSDIIDQKYQYYGGDKVIAALTDNISSLTIN
eukprot:TRINITY_DN2204_c1_g1_i1.p1 TRINITY_DN2204_c1_g1~~TRINITY_DN2204_c1_g1_i1.p1  ORF type:complete len:370 (+),score=159.70 TRINITY_DN2204_c1_g1_i1:63-1172(+)